MNNRNREWPVGFKGIVGMASCVIGLGVVYFGYGIGTESLKKDAAVGPRPAEQTDRKRAVRAMNMALGDMVFFARDLGFGVEGVKEEGEVNLDKIAARIEGQLQEIRELYRQEIIKNSTLTGGLTLQLSIGPTGVVSQVRELSSRLKNDDFKQAVIAAASKWSFGEIVEEDLQVNCPLLFVHQGMDITTLVQWEKSTAPANEKAALAQPVDNSVPVQPSVVARGAARPNLRPATVAKPDAKEFQIKYATVLRKDPDFSSPSLATFTIGTKVTVLRRHGDWLEVRASANGRTGFIRKEFVTPLEVAHH